jgi:hypothetical protein
MLLPKQVTIHSDHPFAGEELSACLLKFNGRAPGREGYPIDIRITNTGGEGYAVSVTPQGTVIETGSARGAVYGVYAFLEEALGCRFLTPDCEILPPGRPRLAVGSFSSAPAFTYREAYWRGALDGRFALKMRLNSARAQIPDEWGGRVRFFNYSHSFDALIGPEEFFDSHPEYFSQVNEKRQRDKSQLCLTNPDVLRIVTGRVRGWMRAHPDCDIFSVAINDWYSPCQCPGCAAIDEQECSQAGSLIAFINNVADAIKDEFPDNFIHTFAYLYCRKPPKHLRPRDNVIVRLCPIERCFSHAIGECDAEVERIDVETTAAKAFSANSSFRKDLEGWAGICKHLYIWDYTTNYANYLQPFPNLSALRGNLRFYQASGVSGVFLQGNYSPGRTSAFAEMKIYLMSRLMWDPMADMDALTARFAAGYYGQAAAPFVLEYVALSEQAARGSHMSLFDPADADYLSWDLIEKGLALLEAALAATKDPVYRERLEREALSPRYVSLVSLPLQSPGRDEQMEAFARDAQRLGVSELFERRELEASFACMRKSRFARDRNDVPHTVYRL